MDDDLHDTKTHDPGRGCHLAVQNPVHHQPERDGGQDYRQDETDQIAVESAVAGTVAMIVTVMVIMCMRMRAHPRTPSR